MALPQLFQTKEVLNKVLNAGEDALKVDIDNVTLDGSQLSVDIDKENDSIVVYSNTTKDGSGTNYVPLVDSDGHLQVDALSSALPSGAATAANQSTIIGHLDGVEGSLTDIETNTDYGATTGGGTESGALRVTIANDSTGVLSVDDGGGALTVDGTVTANLSATDNAVLDTIDATLDNMLYGTGLVVTAVHGGSDQAFGSTYQSLYVGVGGDVVVTLATSGSDFTFKNVASGQLLPIQITHVKATNTTATNMIAMKA